MAEFKQSASVEREVRQKLEELLPKAITITKASKYTESEEVFQDKEEESPLDYYVNYKSQQIAALEVTESVPGYTIRNSRSLPVGERKVNVAKKLQIPSYMIYVITAESNKTALERFAWCPFELVFNVSTREMVSGKGWTKKENVSMVPVSLWKIGLQSLAEELKKRAGFGQVTLF